MHEKATIFGIWHLLTYRLFIDPVCEVSCRPDRDFRFNPFLFTNHESRNKNDRNLAHGIGEHTVLDLHHSPFENCSSTLVLCCVMYIMLQRLNPRTIPTISVIYSLLFVLYIVIISKSRASIGRTSEAGSCCLLIVS